MSLRLRELEIIRAELAVAGSSAESPLSLGSAAAPAWGRGDSGRKTRPSSHPLRPWFRGDDGVNPALTTQQLSRESLFPKVPGSSCFPRVGNTERTDALQC